MILYLGAPASILYLCRKYQFLNRIGAIVLCYALGLLLGVLGLSESGFSNVQDGLMNVTVPLAIPLLLFSSNVRAWKTLAVQPFYSLLFALLAVLMAVVSGFVLFNGANIPDFNKVGGLLVGIYSGGTPNLASLKMVLGVEEEVYLAVHSYDMLIGAFYLFFLMGLGQRVFHMVLPRYKHNAISSDIETSNIELWLVARNNRMRKKLLVTFLLALVMVAVAGGIMVLLPDDLQMIVFIFLITSFGIIGSSSKRINKTEGSFDLGMYLILIFSIVVSSKVQLTTLTEINPAIFAYITFVVFVSLFLHVVLARFRKIDADTVIITSAALICSPPFVPVVAGSLRNRSVIVPGLTIGLIGYAIGNYLGYLVSELLALL